MLRKLLLIPILLLAISFSAGCATQSTLGKVSSASQATVTAQDAAAKTLYAFGSVLQSTPGILTALYDSGKLSKQDYNNIVPVYNQALGSFNLAVSALDVAVKAGGDPNQASAYTEALTGFLLNKRLLEDMLLAMGASVPPTNTIEGVK